MLLERCNIDACEPARVGVARRRAASQALKKTSAGNVATLSRSIPRRILPPAQSKPLCSGAERLKVAWPAKCRMSCSPVPNICSNRSRVARAPFSNSTSAPALCSACRRESPSAAAPGRSPVGSTTSRTRVLSPVRRSSCQRATLRFSLAKRRLSPRSTAGWTPSTVRVSHGIRDASMS